jgi:DHA3 family macrolide efflux protein-like MFS transporter
MVPKKHLSRVAGANQTLNGIMNILGPALGAFLIAALPMQGVLFIDVSTAFFAMVPLLFFTIPQPARNGSVASGESSEKTSVWQDLAQGWRYVVGWPSLMAIILVAMLVNFLINPAFSLLPLLVTEHFGMGAYELGFINSAFGVGVVIGGLVLSAWGGFKNRILTSMVALTLSGAAVLTVGVAPANMYLLALAGVALFGFLNPMVNGPLFAVMQAKVEPELQGRVFTLLNAGSGLASPLGLIIAGPVADATNNQLWFIIGGAATILTGLVAFFVPDVRAMGLGMDEEQPEQEHSATAGKFSHVQHSEID